MECDASSHMIDMTMGYLYLTICSNIVDTLLCFLSLDPRLGTPPSQEENTTSVEGSRPGCFGRVHRLSKYHKVTSLSWIFGSNEQKMNWSTICYRKYGCQRKAKSWTPWPLVHRAGKYWPEVTPKPFIHPYILLGWKTTTSHWVFGPCTCLFSDMVT